MNIILMGPPGSGKGTQSEKLCDKYNIGHISTGDIIRNHIKEKTDFGLYAEDVIAKGNFIPDEKMIPILQEEMKKYPNGVLLDGFPRTIPQAKALDKSGVSIDKVIEVAVPDEEIITRITGRVKGDDGKIYHLTYNPPPEGMKYSQRKDDTEDVVKTRLTEYHEKTAPILDYYKEKGLLLTVDGTKPIDEVFKSLTDILGE